MELQEQIEKYCATKVELMAFRDEVAVQFGKVHTAIVIVIANASISLAIARYLS